MGSIIDFEELFKKRIFNSRIVEKEFPQHIAISTQSFETWVEKNNSSMEKAAEKHLGILNELIEWQVKKDLPILTINLAQTPEEYKFFLKNFFDDLAGSSIISDNQTRIFVVGKWYDLSPSIVDSIKNVMSKTKDYDKFFLNLCVNYDGQDEIASSLKLMARKIEAQKLQVEDVTKEMIKENLFTSYFLPPQLMIEPGNTFSGVLLWDSQGAVVHFTGKNWLDFDKKHLDEGVELYSTSEKHSKEKPKE